MQPQFYLDTCALRQLSPRLGEIASVSFTSSWTILEIISGVTTEKEYSIRRAVLKSVTENKLPIDRRTPIEVIVSAFPQLKYKEQLHDDMDPIVSLFQSSTSYHDFMNRQAALSKGIDYFADLDTKFTKGFRANVELQMSQLRELKASHNAASIGVKPAEAINSVRQFVWSNIRKHPLLATHPGLDRMHYNGSIELFIDILQLFFLSVASFNEPDDNDFIDIHHAVYLGTKGQGLTLVSNDGKLQNWMNKAFAGHYKSVEEFKSMLL